MGKDRRCYVCYRPVSTWAVSSSELSLSCTPAAAGDTATTVVGVASKDVSSDEENASDGASISLATRVRDSPSEICQSLVYY